MKKGLCIFCVVFITTGMFTLSSLKGSNGIELQEKITRESKGESIAKLCISNVFPTVSRGADFEKRHLLAEQEKEAEEAAKAATEELEQAEQASKNAEGETPQTVVSPLPEESKPAENVPIDETKPIVIIYHTHATESYMPASDGNFHSTEEANTVREVGNVLTAELEAKGIQVIHDKTLHDRPSYNQSYSRSLETVKKLIAENNQRAQVVIDLHRDAAAYTGNGGKSVKINGQTVAKYNLVVGNGNENVNNLKAFANKINTKAEALYPGFGGRTIDKEYKYNQWVSNNHILLEIGNNANTIEEAKLNAKYFANVLYEVMKEM